MTDELEPTLEHLSDPYVLQLIEALAKRDDEIERLRSELDQEKVQALLNIKRKDREIERLRAKLAIYESISPGHFSYEVNVALDRLDGIEP